MMIFFDMDGLLIDSEKIYNECWVYAAAEMGYELSIAEALKLRSLDANLAQEFLREMYCDEKAYTLIRKQRKKIMSEILKEIPLKSKPGVEYILEVLEAKKIDCAIVTSAPVARAKEYLESAGIRYEFKNIISTEFVKRGKPFPDVYQYAISTLKIDSSHVLALEDSPNGLKSAHLAGCKTVMIPDLTDWNNEMKEYVDYKFDSLTECADFIKMNF